MTRTGHARQGFTLVEILLSLAILSVVLLLLLSAFTGAARSREALTARSREFRQIRIALDRIGTDLQGAFSSAIRQDSALTCKEDQLSGNPAATFVFTAFQLPEPGVGRPPANVVKIKYYPRVGADGTSMELHREQSDLPFLENKIPLREALLAVGLKGFRVELYNGTGWVKEWPPPGKTSTTLPKKAAVTLMDSRGDAYRREILLPLSGQEGVLTYSGRRGVSPQ
jgi:prepilin-type N-terminal cleavage/methylation domain-containing protein